MATDATRREIVRRLDEENRRHADGAKPHELRVALRDGVVELLANEDRDIVAEADQTIADVQEKTRRQRRASLAKNIEYILDAFAESEDAAYIDPMLDQAYPIGTEDGRTKTLRYWTKEDFQTSIQMAYRKSAEAVAAAREHDRWMQAAIESMYFRGVQTFGAATVRQVA
jgi:hypothetical protein